MSKSKIIEMREKANGISNEEAVNGVAHMWDAPPAFVEEVLKAAEDEAKILEEKVIVELMGKPETTIIPDAKVIEKPTAKRTYKKSPLTVTAMRKKVKASKK